MMEDDIRKQGLLYLQQQRFGKKWKRVWCVLYRESSCSISRLEFFECKDAAGAEKNDRSLRKQQEHKKVIRLADCIRVSEVEVYGVPRDTGPFLIETTEKIYVFAADRQQLEDWTQGLCEIAFPMSWAEHGAKRGSLQRGKRVEEDEGMENNSLYSRGATVRDFKVFVRRTEASDRCRLKGNVVLRADEDALHLIDQSGDVMFTWPYRYLRRFGRDKSSFSFEAGRRCNSGEGNFEFDTKQGNFLFQALEAAINLQRISLPNRQTSGEGQMSPETPPDTQSRMLPQPNSHIPQSPAPPQVDDSMYAMVMEAPHLPMMHHRDKEVSIATQLQQQRPLLARPEPSMDQALTAVKSLTLDPRDGPAPRKSQVKMISSCPLPPIVPDLGPAPNARLSPKLNSSPDQMYSQITEPAPTERNTNREMRGSATLAITPQEPEYSLPFDTIAINIITKMLDCHRAHDAGSGGDPLYDSIDDMKIRNTEPMYRKVEHIYDEPEGCAAAAATLPQTHLLQPPSLYDDPKEVTGDAWRIMGSADDPKGHEYPYNPWMDDYAVPKRPQREFPVTQGTNKAVDDREEGPEETEEEQREDSTYNNVMVKMM